MAKIPTQLAIVTAYIILERDNKVFIMRRANTGFMDGFSTPPAGKSDINENFITTAIREAKEEVGVVIEEKDLTLVHTGHRLAEPEKPYWIDVFFKCTHWQGEPYIAETEKANSASWSAYENIGTTENGDVDLYFAQVFSKIQKGEAFSTFGWNNEERILTSKEAA